MPTLSSCVTCGQPVSEGALACPHCGERNPTEAAKRDMRVGLGIGFAIFAVAAVAWVAFVMSCFGGL